VPPAGQEIYFTIRAKEMPRARGAPARGTSARSRANGDKHSARLKRRCAGGGLTATNKFVEVGAPESIFQSAMPRPARSSLRPIVLLKERYGEGKRLGGRPIQDQFYSS
jgi:hypothetical protein